MRVSFTVVKGPHLGAEFVFEEYASFVVGRHKKTQFRLPLKDLTLSRFHFSVELNPPQCVLIDLGSTNSTFVNGQRVKRVELNDGDFVKAGKSTLQVAIDNRGEASAAPPPLDPGDVRRIAQYRIERKLGAGTSGWVYLAVDENTNARIALKLMPDTSAINRGSDGRFQREAEALRRLDHDNIIRLFDAGQADQWLYLAMEYVPGPDASKVTWSRGGVLPVGQAVDITRQTLAALGHAHAEGIIHRDVKPNNIIISRVGGHEVAKLGDFGLAKLYGKTFYTRVTQAGEIGGTLGFLAPEQARDMSAAGPRADLYGAGATLYFMLTGKLPFEFPDDFPECLRMILNEPPTPIREVRPEVPEDLADVVDKALAREPEDRYSDAESMRRALARWASAAGPAP